MTYQKKYLIVLCLYKHEKNAIFGCRFSIIHLKKSKKNRALLFVFFVELHTFTFNRLENKIMPSKSRWTLNPKKWFGTITNVPHRRETNKPLPRTATTTTTIRTIPSQIINVKSKTKVIPNSFSYDINNNTAASSVAITQLQLPAFCVRREKPSTLLPPTTFSRGNSFFPTHTEPTIRKNGRLEEDLCINTTRWNMQPIPSTTIYDPAKTENAQQNTPLKQIEIGVSNMSRRCCSW
jgi:hypothetical protein